jgi:peptidoglycan/LPS O-acetylase OafA/YrhL
MFEVFWLAQEHFPQALGRSTDLGHVVGLAVLLLTLPVAALLHGLVEEPARLRLARLARQVRHRRPSPPPTRPIVFIPARWARCGDGARRPSPRSRAGAGRCTAGSPRAAAR